MKKIGVLTSGGDSPGMNAAVRAVTRGALTLGYEIYGIYYGYRGLLEKNIEKFDWFSVAGKINIGGTFLKSSRFPEFKKIEVRQEAKKILAEYGITSLIVIGGDGTFSGAAVLSELGVKVICLPGTIDNDLGYTDYTIGFDTCVNTVVEAVDKVRDTSGSHHRCTVVEVMGRSCGEIAVNAAIATGSEYLITPETGFNKNDLVEHLKNQNLGGIKYSIIMITEKMTNVHQLAQEIEEITGIDTRATVLGYVQRGGSPSAFDRVLATKFGKKAIELIDRGVFNRCIGIKNNSVIDLDITEALNIDRKGKLELLETFKITL